MNSIGSYRCECPTGKKLDNDLQKCVGAYRDTSFSPFTACESTFLISGVYTHDVTKSPAAKLGVDRSKSITDHIFLDVYSGNNLRWVGQKVG